MNGPFTRAMALALGVTARMLNGKRFERVFPDVWNVRGRTMSDLDWIKAAILAMPARARLTGISLIRALGLDYGQLRPIQFVITGDLHLDIEDIDLHRTVRLPPATDNGVSPAAAFIAYCVNARVIDAIKVGDWLLHHQHMTVIELREVARMELWRPGSRQALWISSHLDGDARSVKESETRAALVFAGLPRPASNKQIVHGSVLLGIGDLDYLRWRLVVEYEGSQHHENRGQWLSDIDRYADFRNAGLNYVQATKEKLDRPRKLVSEVYRQLIAGGYDGPAPEFGSLWRSLFEPINQAKRRAGGSGTTRSSRMVPEPPAQLKRGA